jgi:hypothetical protein
LGVDSSPCDSAVRHTRKDLRWVLTPFSETRNLHQYDFYCTNFVRDCSNIVLLPAAGFARVVPFYLVFHQKFCTGFLPLTCVLHTMMMSLFFFPLSLSPTSDYSPSIRHKFSARHADIPMQNSWSALLRFFMFWLSLPATCEYRVPHIMPCSLPFISFLLSFSD